MPALVRGVLFSARSSAVGWVERSDTHQLHLMEMMGFAGSTHPTNWTIRPVLPPSNRTGFMMFSAVECGFARP
jgi:hypothetical protein